LILAIILGYLPLWSWLFIIVIMALNFFFTVGTGLWLSALNVKYRDVANLLPVVLLIGNYLSPTLYPSALVPPEYFPYYAINPMVGLMDATRWALFQTSPFPGYAFIFTVLFSILLPVTGFIYFQKRSSAIIDIV